MSTRFHVRKAAVLGAGVMGAQIAAHLTNAGIPTVLFDLPAKDGDKNGIVQKAIANLTKLSPAPFGLTANASKIEVANYDEHLDKLKDCDLIIEAVAERMDIKLSLYTKIAGYVKDGAIIGSNTSGLSISKLADALPANLKDGFCGVHFFNPPRYMYLVELVPTPLTDPAVVDALETLLTSTLGKGVVRAKDTPNFIGNRIGAFSILATMHHTERFGLGFDEVDALTGPLIGRPKSATYRTCDVVGLDTMSHVMKTMQDNLQSDPWYPTFQAPAWQSMLIEKGALGQKSGAGFYTKKGKDILVLDVKTKDYRPSKQEASADAEGALRQKGWAGKLAALRKSDDPHCQFVWSCFRDLFHYCAYTLAEIADNARDLDLAIRWGYGWDKGPFEIWQEAGWQQVTAWINEDIAAGKTLSNAALPAWVSDGRDGVYSKEGAFSPASGGPRGRSTLPVYARQHFPDPVLAEEFDRGTTIFETDAVRCWDQGDDVAILSFKTKMNTVSPDVLAGIHQAIDAAEAGYRALVIWQTKEPFSAGADLSAAIPLVVAGDRPGLLAAVAGFQAASMRIKYAQVPVVSAVRGMCFGGGCEFQMHSAKTVAALESYVGLVEAGVGLLPGGGGCKEFALRCAGDAIDGDVFQQVRTIFETLAMAKVATSALEAKAFKLLRPTDVVVMNSYELLHVAKNEARALAESGYRPPMPATAIKVAGDVGIATLRASLTNLQEGNFASEHDVLVATKIGTVLCGGDIERGSEVDEEWLLNQERQNFVDLVLTEKSQQRVAHTLQTGKPLRN